MSEEEIFKIFCQLKTEQNSWYSVIQIIEEAVLKQALKETPNKSHLAKKLGLNRTTLVMKLKLLGL
jgi:transcriptional regulator with PAS, ATPase and Fis domain